MVDKEKALELRMTGAKYADIAKELNCSIAWCKANLRGTRKTKKKRRDKKTSIKKIHRQFPCPIGYYVYCAVLGDEIVYVGKGVKWRYEHINSGKSGNYELNLCHFSGIVFNVFILYEGLSEDDAYEKESEEIMRAQPKYNKTMKS